MKIPIPPTQLARILAILKLPLYSRPIASTVSINYLMVKILLAAIFTLYSVQVILSDVILVASVAPTNCLVSVRGVQDLSVEYLLLLLDVGGGVS